MHEGGVRIDYKHAFVFQSKENTAFAEGGQKMRLGCRSSQCSIIRLLNPLDAIWGVRGEREWELLTQMRKLGLHLVAIAFEASNVDPCCAQLQAIFVERLLRRTCS